jgi:hypothetical protein
MINMDFYKDSWKLPQINNALHRRSCVPFFFGERNVLKVIFWNDLNRICVMKSFLEERSHHFFAMHFKYIGEFIGSAGYSFLLTAKRRD